MAEIFVGKLSEFDNPGRKVITRDEMEIGVFHIDGEVYAYENTCPHQGGPLGDGFLQKGDDGELYVVCPWHAWEYDPLIGKSPPAFDDPDPGHAGFRGHPREHHLSGKSQ